MGKFRHVTLHNIDHVSENWQRRATTDNEGPLERVSQVQPYQTTREERARHVAQMRANFAIEDMHAQGYDLGLQQRYIDGDIALADMLAHAHNFARQLEKSNNST
jgi:hypothetical protein